jgi:hypothetical protein
VKVSRNGEMIENSTSRLILSLTSEETGQSIKGDRTENGVVWQGYAIGTDAFTLLTF